MSKQREAPLVPDVIQGGATLRGANMTRGQVAKTLGVSITAVRKMEDQGRLTPEIGPGRIRYFDVQQVQTVTRMRFAEKKTNGTGVVDGNLGADVFARLEAGEPPVQIVIQMRLPPDLVERLAEQHARMHGALLLTRENVDEIGSADLLGARPSSASIMIAGIRAISAPLKCDRCSKRPAVRCVPCTRKSD